ncbi:MAG: GMC family oxidoreductase [Actinomycetota bacterium]|nr:GMC family oxidoreductase [Actinomycetota bacterium]
MQFDSRALADGAQIDADVCIVGAGPAGIALARELIGQGPRVCVLESGDATPLRSAQELNRGENSGYTYMRLHDARVRAFGGTSRHWPLSDGWRSRPLDAVDFEPRPAIPHSGWPFERAHLEGYYRRAQSICDLGPYGYGADAWERPATYPFLPLGTEVRTTMFHLGRTTFERYHGELARAANVSLFLHAHVVDIATDGNPRTVDRVEAKRDDGRGFSVRARLFVLATGGIENARLLLLSDRTHRRGLGNDHDLVGRFFMEKLSTRSGFILPAASELVDRAKLYDSAVIDGHWVQAAARVDDDVIRREGLRNCVFYLLPRTQVFTSEGLRSLATLKKVMDRRPLPRDTLRHLRNVVTNVDDLARLAAHFVTRSGEGVLVVRPQAEQAPDPASRVTLGSTKDRLGLRRARLAWRMTEEDRRSIRRSQEILDQALRGAGLGRMRMPLGDEDPPALFEGNSHHIGTTRMHVDPKQGVVDQHGKVHGLTNLFVAGSSVFPTEGCSNPTLTIVALSLRLADHVKKLLAGESGADS